MSYSHFRTSTVESNYYDSSTYATQPLCASLPIGSEKDSNTLQGKRSVCCEYEGYQQMSLIDISTKHFFLQSSGREIQNKNKDKTVFKNMSRMFGDMADTFFTHLSGF